MDTLIAVTTTLNPQGGDHRKPRVELYANYIRVLARYGLTSVLVTPAHEPDAVDALVRSCAGLVLTGGEDVEPARYGETPVPEIGEVNTARDAMEWRALEAALGHHLPVLGICRGMQLLNVYFGGTLYQDLPTQRPQHVRHYQDAPWGQHQHVVGCVGGTRLEAILQECGQIEINSFHHQAVKELAPGMVCGAEAEDGLIEAIESTEHDRVMGVQWHPERQEAEAASSDPNALVLDAFARQVRIDRP